MAQSRLALLTAILAGVLINGCAAPSNEVKHLVNQEHDLSTRAVVRLDYFTDDGGCVLLAVANNPRRYFIRLWLSQSFSTDGERTSSERRYYSGTDEVIDKMFRLDCPGIGVTHAMRVEMYDRDGSLIFRTREIETRGDNSKGGVK